MDDSRDGLWRVEETGRDGLWREDEPIDTAAANAEAARLARELGVDPTTAAASNSRQNYTRHGWGFGAIGGRGGRGPASTSGTENMNISSSRAGSIAMTSTAAQQQQQDSYRRLDTDNATLQWLGTSASPQVHPSLAAENAARKVAALESSSNATADRHRQQSAVGGGGGSWNQVQNHDPVPFFDSHGQQAPYREGPYYIARQKDGRVIKKRWCKCANRFVLWRVFN